eukprot:5512146-Pyramimonas_sp.AAC.1
MATAAIGRVAWAGPIESKLENSKGSAQSERPSPFDGLHTCEREYTHRGDQSGEARGYILRAGTGPGGDRSCEARGYIPAAPPRSSPPLGTPYCPPLRLLLWRAPPPLPEARSREGPPRTSPARSS